MGKPIISVIVPVYNVEKYLPRCIESILAQSFTDFEVLLIDDGSKDRSGDICDKYAEIDKRIRVFHKENGGVSSARNIGIEYAIGEYSIHIDPDDWVETTMLEELYNKGKSLDADMVICDYYYNDEKGQKLCRQHPSGLNNLTVLKELFTHLHGSCWNKLVKQSCYKEHHITFPQDINCCEDLIFNVRLLNYPINICYLSKAFYHYTHNSNSGSLSQVNLQRKDSYELILKLTDLLKHSIPTDIYNKYIYPLWEYNIMCNAFKHHFFSSSQFKQRFRHSKKFIFQNSVYPKLKVFLFFSCLGFYRQSYWIYIFLQTQLRQL